MTDLSTALEGVAASYFRRYSYPDWLAGHSRLVGRVAQVLADARRAELDPWRVGLAAYLHDIGRSPLLAGDPREHNDLSALVLAAEGLAACAEMAKRHPVYSVLEPALAPRSLAETIVYYADRRAGMEVLSLDDRISETAARHPKYAASIERSRPRAHEIERELFAAMALRPEDIAREVASRWP